MKDAPRIYGTVTVGSKGQVVIPMKARKARNIREGDQLIVMSGPPGSDIVSLIPTTSIAGFLKHFESHIAALKKELTKRKRI